MTESRDLLYNQCIDNACCYSFFIYPTGRIRVCKIRFVSTAENRGKPCGVCNKKVPIHEIVFVAMKTTEVFTYFETVSIFLSNRQICFWFVKTFHATGVV